MEGYSVAPIDSDLVLSVAESFYNPACFFPPFGMIPCLVLHEDRVANLQSGESPCVGVVVDSIVNVSLCHGSFSQLPYFFQCGQIERVSHSLGMWSLMGRPKSIVTGEMTTSWTRCSYGSEMLWQCCHGLGSWLNPCCS